MQHNSKVVVHAAGHWSLIETGRYLIDEGPINVASLRHPLRSKREDHTYIAVRFAQYKLDLIIYT